MRRVKIIKKVIKTIKKKSKKKSKKNLKEYSKMTRQFQEVFPKEIQEFFISKHYLPAEKSRLN